MMHSCRRLLPLALGLGLAAQDPEAAPERLKRPDLSTEEGGLWALCDRQEERLKQNPLLVKDAALNAYVQDLVCRLAGPHCPDIRVYVVRTPYFNANMAPNGMMQVWTGLLLRCENEAQLAAVLGHEIGHYLLRHSLARLKDVKSRSAFASVIMIVPIAGPLAAAGALAGGFAYSRDHERQADLTGLQNLAAVGYPAQEASKVWAHLMDELQAEKDWSGDAGRRSVLFSTHPPERERQATLEAQAARLGPATRDSGAAAHRKAIAAVRSDWMEDELKRRRFGESVALLARLSAADPTDGQARYYLAEAYRLRNAEGDPARFREALEASLALPGVPPEAQRALGFLQQKAGRMDLARPAFARYLELRPDADDADMIRTYLKDGH